MIVWYWFNEQEKTVVYTISIFLKFIFVYTMSKDKIIPIRVSKEHHQDIKRFAKQQGMSMSKLMLVSVGFYAKAIQAVKKEEH